MKYSLILNKCVKVFGKKNVKFINYELLNNDKKVFLKNIFLFMEIKNFSYKNLSPKNISKKSKDSYHLKGPKIKKLIVKNLENRRFLKKFFLRKSKYFLIICWQILLFNLKKIMIGNQIAFNENFLKKINNYYREDNKKFFKMKSLVTR